MMTREWLLRTGTVIAILLVAIAPWPGSALGAGAPVEIELATWHWTEPGRGDALRKIVTAFTNENPSIKVKEGSIPYPRFEDTMSVRLAGGSAPDVLVASDTDRKSTRLNSSH